jgi:methyltransferase family protein
MENKSSGLKSFFGKGAPPEVSSGKENPNLHRTLGLKEFMSRLAGRGKPHLLDLGPALERNIIYLAGRGCKVYVQDFFFELQNARRETAPDQAFSFQNFLQTSFSYPPDTFDGVLVWDLLNYLSPKDAHTLARQLFTQMKTGGVLLAFFSSTQMIPSRPLVYRIEDSHNLHYENHDAEEVKAPNFTNNEIVKMMDRFAVVNFYFLRNGVREALLAKK